MLGLQVCTTILHGDTELQTSLRAATIISVTCIWLPGGRLLDRKCKSFKTLSRDLPSTDLELKVKTVALEKPCLVE